MKINKATIPLLLNTLLLLLFMLFMRNLNIGIKYITLVGCMIIFWPILFISIRKNHVEIARITHVLYFMVIELGIILTISNLFILVLSFKENAGMLLQTILVSIIGVIVTAIAMFFDNANVAWYKKNGLKPPLFLGDE